LASVDGVDFGLQDPRFAAGAAFHLSAPVAADATITLAQGACVSLSGGFAVAVVRLPDVPAGGARKLLVETHEAAQCALDIVTVSPSTQGLTIPDGHQQHFLWWRRRKRTTLRYTSRVVSTSSASANGVVTRSDGTIVPPPSPPPITWHPSLRYFRLAQTTDDLYNAYRNMYLAFEAIMSDKVAPRLANENEGDWLERALGILNQTLPLARYVKPGVTNLIKAFIKEQYKAHRCALFHAKSGEGPLLPGSLAERTQVGRALEHLAQLVLDAIRHYLAGRRGSSGLTIYAFTKAIEDVHSRGLTMAISEDDTPFERQQAKVSPGGMVVVDLRTRYEGAIDGIGHELATLGEIEVRGLPAMTIRTVGSHVAGAMATREVIPAVELAGVDTFETQLVWVHRNQGELTRQFAL